MNINHKARKKKILEQVAFPYARALFELVSQNEEELNLAQNLLLNLSQAIASNAELKSLFREPSLNAEQKQTLVLKLCPEIINFIILKKFIGLLSSKNKLYLLPDVYIIFCELTLEKDNICSIELISAKPLEESLINKIKESLAGSLNKQININNLTEPDIIGGLIIKTENYVLDNSFKTKLKSLEKALLKSN